MLTQSQPTFEHEIVEKRAFNVHPGIIRHLIKEQAGTLEKAVAELVMNSVDAGATRIDLNFRRDGTFTVQDNGRGFGGRDEIERFFETFGTPHVEGDAHFGRFRIGRGQIMAFADTNWRSGHFMMSVRLLSNAAPLGYTLTETAESVDGCQIEGEITEENVLSDLLYSGLVRVQKDDEWWHQYGGEFVKAVQFVTVPIYLNGVLINTSPACCTWSFEDDFGYYLFDSTASLKVYNQGIFVNSEPRRTFCVGGIFVSKQPIKLNMARNAWLKYACPVIQNLEKVSVKFFRAAIRESSRMNDKDLGALIYRVVRGNLAIDDVEAEILFDKRFILDLSGRHLSPREFMAKSHISLYDGVSSLIAERAESEGKIGILVPRMFALADLEQTEDLAVEFMHAICDLFGKLMGVRWNIRFVSFKTIKASYSGITKQVPDADLDPKQLAAIRALRFVASDICRLTRDNRKQTRKIIAGESDTANGWTNGFDYIAINTKSLSDAFWSSQGGVTSLVTLAVHEYCHQGASSSDEHEHGIEFYKRYHDATRDSSFESIVRNCHRKYMHLLLKSETNISYEDRLLVLAMRRFIGKSDIACALERRAFSKRMAEEAAAGGDLENDF